MWYSYLLYSAGVLSDSVCPIFGSFLLSGDNRGQHFHCIRSWVGLIGSGTRGKEGEEGKEGDEGQGGGRGARRWTRGKEGEEGQGGGGGQGLGKRNKREKSEGKEESCVKAMYTKKDEKLLNVCL